MKQLKNKKGLSFILGLYLIFFLIVVLVFIIWIVATIFYSPCWFHECNKVVEEVVNNTVVYTGG